MILQKAWLKKKLQMSLERCTGYRVYFYSGPTHGHESIVDVRRSGVKIDTVFDIGANVGQSAIEYLVGFPGSRIHCFEPVSDTYAKLKDNTQGANVECHQLAMGSQPGTAEIFIGDSSLVSSLVWEHNGGRSESVTVSTVDDFAESRNISCVDLLKIDAEGYDLEVLEGANSMISAGRVKFVQLEISFHPEDTRHVLFDKVREFLLPRGFSVFGIYEQTLEYSDMKRMRYANALFIQTDLGAR